MRTVLIDCSLALRNVVRQRRRSALALIAVAFGVVALVLGGGFVEWNFWNYRESIIKSQLGHIRVHRAGYLDSGLADPFAFLLPERAAALDAISGHPHVRVVAPRLSLSGLVSRGESTISFLGEGMDPGAEAELSRMLIIRAGENLSPEDPDGIIMGYGLAQNLGAGVGDKVVLLITTTSGGVNAVEVHIRGLFSTVSKGYDDAALRIPIVTARKLLRVTGAHAWVLLLDDTRNTEPMLAAFRQQFAAEGYEFVPWSQLADFYNKSAALFSKQVGVMKLIIGALIVLSISNTLIMGVMERVGEIGTSMALGTRRRTVLRQFIAEGALLGVLGGVAGLILGWLLALMISAIGIPIPPPPGMAQGYIGRILVTPGLALDAIGLAVGTALLASLYPAWKASRMVIVDALRHYRA